MSFLVGVGKALGDHDDSRYSGVGAVFDDPGDMLPGRVEDGDIDGLRDVPDVFVGLQAEDFIGLGIDGKDLSCIAEGPHVFDQVEAPRAALAAGPDDGYGAGVHKQVQTVFPCGFLSGIHIGDLLS